MYSPIRHQFSFSGLNRYVGYGAGALSFLVLVLGFFLDFAMTGWMLLLGSAVVLLLSYMPSLTWYYTRFSLRKWPLGERTEVEFKNIDFIAVGEKAITIKARGMTKTLKLSLLTFSQSERNIICKLFAETEKVLKSVREEAAVKVQVTHTFAEFHEVADTRH